LRYWTKVAAVVAFTFCLLAGPPRALGVSSQQSANAIAGADQALRAAFVNVSDAERAGANVSGLIARLNVAGSEFTSAQVAFDAGNYSDAVSLAGLSRVLADGVAVDAGELKNDAVAQTSSRWMTVFLSFVGSAASVAVLFLVWRRFKRFYWNRLLKNKPEVAG
jgi:hypothetical protein